MLEDPLLMKAVTSLNQRSEKMQNERKFIETFVDFGMLAQILNNNNQIIYGRRGTGKTHIFQVVASNLRDDPLNVVLSIDCRTLGSSSQFVDTTIPIKYRCTALFKDVLFGIRNCLLDHTVNNPTANTDRVIDALSEFTALITEPSSRFTSGTVSGLQKGSTKTESKFGGSFSVPPSINLTATAGNSSTSDTEKRVTMKVELEENVVFPPMHNLLEEILTKSNARLFILFDEWSSLPIDIQPFLAELLKRGVLPVTRSVVKIASLEYRSRFWDTTNGRRIGFEIGADISANLDLDDYFVFDRNPEHITTFMADIVFKHLSSNLPENYLETKYGISSGDELSSRMFTQRPTFKELVRASEGVIRDLINIFTSAYFDCQRRGRTNIDLKAIEQAARSWFETDKEQNLDGNLRKILQSIVDNVIGQRQARSFLVERDLEKHSVIQQLADSRIIHLVKRGYADKDNPGRRYSIYTLDYGTYVDLIHTSKQPELDMIESSDGVVDSERIVPFDDKRSIRRIILTNEILDAK
jgi:hypothetical protein